MPDKLYRAKMAYVKTPFFSSFMVNDIALQERIMLADNSEFPKATSIYGSLDDLLKGSSFVINGEEWEFQRRILDAAFRGGRVKLAYPQMQICARDLLARLKSMDLSQPIEMEFECSYFASDVIFRTMFSKPITHDLAKVVFDSFQIYQRAQPVWNLPNILRFPKWFPRRYAPSAKRAAKRIHDALGELVDQRIEEMKSGQAPEDLVTNILRLKDKKTGRSFSREDAVGNIALFFIAGHETSASAFAWGLYLLAMHQDQQQVMFEEINAFNGAEASLNDLQKMPKLRNALMETLRLYPPVPMMVREATHDDEFRERAVKAHDLCIISPWYSGRYEGVWENAHAFHPERWNDLSAQCRSAHMPFSKGPRICPGAGFAQIELMLGLSSVLKEFHIEITKHKPIPVSHLTLRSLDGIYLRLNARN